MRRSFSGKDAFIFLGEGAVEGVIKVNFRYVDVFCGFGVVGGVRSEGLETFAGLLEVAGCFLSLYVQTNSVKHVLDDTV